MADERATLEQLIEEYAAATSDAMGLALFVRDIDLQRGTINTLSALKERFRGFKRGAREAGDENAANLIFHLQCGLNALISFLSMWVELKNENYQKAWCKIIDAQEYVSVAMRASANGTGLNELLDHVRQAEKVIFPAFPVYNSVAQIVRGGTCTVCGQAFSTCEHIEGKVYWGMLCLRVKFEIVSVDHVAIVDEPRDRRCVITEITHDDGYYRDYMTRRKTRKAEELEKGTAGRFTGVILHAESLEID